MTAADIKNLIGRLLPPGLDYAGLDPRVNRLLAGLGRALKRADDSATAFDTGAVADRTTGDRLAAWESACNLPDKDYPDTNGTDAARQAEVRRVLAQGGLATPAAFVALAAVWSITATVWEPTGWPCQFWMVGPTAHIHPTRFGTGHFGDTFVFRSATWTKVMHLVNRLKPAHLLVGDTD